jgi:type II secretory pathway pseudopilin PulG
MPEPQKEGKSKATLIAVAILVAIIAGGGMWYWMNSRLQTNKKANLTQISQLQSSITSLNSQLTTAKKAAKTTTTTTTTTSTASSSNKLDVDALKAYCTAQDGYPNVVINPLVYTETTNGKYALCGIGHTNTIGGGLMIVVRQNNAWNKIFYGNGAVSPSLCSQYKIPNSIVSTCQY